MIFLGQSINRLTWLRSRLSKAARAMIPLLFLLITSLLPWSVWSGEPADPLLVSPLNLHLQTPESSEQILVTATAAGLHVGDVTRLATYTVEDPTVVEVSSQGRVIPKRDGQTNIDIHFEGRAARTSVRVTGIAQPPKLSFRHDIIPILSKAGCNSGGCHGKAEGQNGLKLSVFGTDPAADFQAMVHESRGRRIFPASSAQSLLLTKATATVPHGGGRRIEFDSRWYRLLQRWIDEGVALEMGETGGTASIRIEPTEVSLRASGHQQIKVTAVDAQGGERCVTVESDYQSNNDVVAVCDRDGQIAATDVPGEAAILVRYMGHVAVCRVTRPRSESDFVRPAERNFIDRLVWEKLQGLHVPVSPLADEATLLRRVYLDTIGTLPTAEEARQYLSDARTDKFDHLIDTLLQRPEYALFWGQQWSELLRIDKDIIASQGAIAMSRWVHDQFASNRPFNEFAFDVLTAQGNTFRESPAAFYQVQGDAEKSARAVSQLFLGVRIDCAQCHHHPMERWDQRDYYALASFFTGLERRPAAGGSQKIIGRAGPPLKHPRTSEPVAAAGLGQPAAVIPQDSDPRVALAQWATSASNPFFTRLIVNRMVAHYFGRGLVEPVDDLRDTNPATNEPLMQALVEHMVEVNYDLKAFSRTLLRSSVYQLSPQPVEGNRLDQQNYSHALWKPLHAGVLLDGVSQVTGIAEVFNGWPAGYRALEIWDHKLPSDFMDVFGRSPRQTVCSCERGTESSIGQALHLMNSETIMTKLQARAGTCAKLASSTKNDSEIIDELYLTTLARFPTASERELMVQAFPKSVSRQNAVEDIMWTLLNTREFVFNH